MDVFALAASITLDTSEYDRELDNASGKTHSFGEKLKSGLATAAKVGAAGLAAATTAIGALSKAALDSYGDYEQLTGGVETLFKTSSDVVMEYANNAYKTAGLSANEYMETVTSFSASLLQSLDGDTRAAAEYADMAITDMSDNANKMGTDMEMIQNAYSGFAKQNFTMLDNLKLGYGGTKEEMERLLADAEKISGIEYDISSYADIVDAIHTVQTEMGISGITAEEAAAAVASGAMTQEEAFAAMGTTAKEAATTIQGSVSAAKSAWSNLVTGIADENSNLDQLITNFVDSVGTAGENIIPRVEQILVGMGSAIQKLAPIIGEQLPPLIQSVLPSLLSAGGELLGGLANGIVAAAPALIETGVPMITSLVSGLTSALPNIASSAVEIIAALRGGISEQLPTLVPVAIDAVLQLAETLTDPDSLDKMVGSAIDLITSLADGLINALPTLIAKAPIIVANLVTAIVENAPKLLGAGLELITSLAGAIIGNLPEIVKAGEKILGSIKEGLGDLLAKAAEWGGQLLTGIWNGITDKIEWLKRQVSNVVDIIKGWFTGESGFDEHSPSKWSEGVAEFVMQGLGIGFKNGKGEVMQTVEDVVGEVKSRFGEISNFFSAKSDVGDLEYKLWERTEGKGVSEIEKYAKKLGLLTSQQEDQTSVVEAAEAAYDAIVRQYGLASEESYKYQKTLLQEKLALQDLLDQIQEINAARSRLQSEMNMQEARIKWEESGLGIASATAMNAGYITPHEVAQIANINLVTPDGKVLAEYTAPALVDYMDANGTPIVNPKR